MPKIIFKPVSFIKREPLLFVLFILLFALGVYYFYLKGMDLALRGDEEYYYRSVKRFVLLFECLFTFNWEKIPPLWSAIIERGWFIPSSSFIITPIGFFTDRLDVFRFYLFVINYILTIFILLKSYDVFGRKLTIILALGMLLMPMYTIYSFTFWGGAISGRLLLLLFIVLAGVELKKEDISLKKSTKIGLVIITMIYFRNSLILVAPCVILYLFILELKLNKPQKAKITDFVKKSSLITLVVVLLLLPWSVSVSMKFDVPTLAVTSANMAYIFCCANQDLRTKINQGKKIWRVRYGQLLKYYRLKAQREQKKLYQLMKEDNIKAKENITFEKSLKMVKGTFTNILFIEDGGRFMKSFTHAEGGLEKKILGFMNSMYANFWKILLGIQMLLFIMVFSVKAPVYISTLFKLILFAAIFPHLLLFAGHERHGIVLIPIMLMGFAFLCSGRLFNKQYFIHNFKSFFNWGIILIQLFILGFTIFILL